MSNCDPFLIGIQEAGSLDPTHNPALNNGKERHRSRSARPRPLDSRHGRGPLAGKCLMFEGPEAFQDGLRPVLLLQIRQRLMAEEKTCAIFYLQFAHNALLDSVLLFSDSSG